MPDVPTGDWPRKLSEEIIIYGVDWSNRLKYDRIQSVNFEADSASNVVISNMSKDGRISKCLISGGDVGETAYIVASITTISGATLAERLRLVII